MKDLLKKCFAYYGYEIRRIKRFSQVVCKGYVVQGYRNNISYRFFVTNRYNLQGIQQFRGHFYEQEELTLVEEHVPRGGIFVDVGANFGNHSIFLAKFLEPEQVIAFEPGKEASRILSVNIGLNELNGHIDMRPIALSNRSGEARLCPLIDGHIGSNSVSQGTEGEIIRLERGDFLLRDLEVRFIKIDVERHEFMVLEGLTDTIGRCRPYMLIETMIDSLGQLEEWCALNNYEIIARIERHGDITNCLVKPN